MAIFELMFSPTGGTKKVSAMFAKGLKKAMTATTAKAISQESVVIDLLKRDKDYSACAFSAKDICIVSVPSYGGRVPETAVSRLSQMKGNGARAILLVVYGNRDYDDTFAELQDTLEAAGFVCAAGIAAIAEHSIMHQFATGRPDQEDEEQLKGFAETIWKKLEKQTNTEKTICEELEKQTNTAETDDREEARMPGSSSAGLVLPGNRPYRKYDGVPMKPQAGKTCTRCGICAKECPAGAIPADNPSKTNTESCISCMRCIAVCPEHARSISKALLAAGSVILKKSCSVRKKNTLFLT